jgi:hypothetical protein
MRPGVAAAQGATVSGVVVNSRQVFIPGLTIYLVHSAVGRSYPSFTDPRGRFFFSNVPLRTDPYYLEIYGGRQLIYRKPVFVRGNIELPLITL